MPKSPHRACSVLRVTPRARRRNSPAKGLDFLAARPEVDGGLGCAGFSHGAQIGACLTAAAAPKPMLVIVEERGAPDLVRQDMQPVAKAYTALGAASSLELQFVTGGHAWHPQIANPWMIEKMLSQIRR